MWIRLADQDVVSKKILHICRNRQNQPLIKGTIFHFMYAIKYVVRAKHVDCNSNTNDGHVFASNTESQTYCHQTCEGSYSDNSGRRSRRQS